MLPLLSIACLCSCMPMAGALVSLHRTGAGVYFTTMITQGVSYRYGNHWRACAAPVSRAFVGGAGRMAVLYFAAAVHGTSEL